MSIYKDEKRGTWYYSVRFKDEHGVNRVAKKRGFVKKSDAVLAERTFILSLTTPKTKSVQMDVLCQSFLDYKKNRVKITSHRSIENMIRLHIKVFFKSIDIRKITPSMMLNFQNKLYSKKLSIKRINEIIGLTYEILKYCDKYVTPFTINKIESLKTTEKKEMDFWTLDEFNSFASTFEKDDRYFAFFYTLFWTGLRIGEALALKWTDINFEEGYIDVNKSLTNKVGLGTYIITTTKTKGSNRKIYINDELIKILNIRLEQSKKIEGFSEDFFVFNCAKPAQVTQICKIKEKHCQLSGVKWIRNHDFRHSHASLLINNDVNISLVAKRLGHANVSMTLNVYGHLYPNKEKEVAYKLEELAGINN